MARVWGIGPLLLGAVLATAGCDSFPAACLETVDCDDGQLCQDGECLDVDPALLTRCEDAVEACNTRDDDCDGVADEGCAPGDDCIAGFGICARMGLLSESPAGLLCSADPGPPDDEACNGLDDDCDGEVDETCPVGALCGIGVGVCKTDGRIATIGGRRVCAIAGVEVEPGQPTDETCGDRADNDCDGSIDEGYAERLGQPCSDGQGICAATGVTVCFEGAVQCSAMPGRPQPETCDRRDNDCDGMTDEDFGTAEPCTAGVGACQTSGMVICNQAQDQAVCSAVPRQASPEQCNGIDDNCNGAVDEDAAGGALTQPCGKDVGECVLGTQTCAGGQWGACIGGTVEIAELCNGRDDDCDGTVDQFTRTCGSNEGICRAGTERCIDGLWSDCLESVQPTAETCDGRDEDCDGVVDEADGTGVASSFVVPCGLNDVGECSTGTRACVGGVLQACSGEVFPVDELCDGLDNDCDGVVDDGYIRLGEACAVTNGACRIDGVRVCAPNGRSTECSVVRDPPPELCDGDDDDCDGRVDEGLFLGAACLDNQAREGVCGCGGAGAVACVVDVGGMPTPRDPTERAGDDSDNDCDGLVDER